MQDDSLFEYFTVREALKFVARLKLNISLKEQTKRIDSIINELGLQQC